MRSILHTYTTEDRLWVHLSHTNTHTIHTHGMVAAAAAPVQLQQNYAAQHSAQSRRGADFSGAAFTRESAVAENASVV